MWKILPAIESSLFPPGIPAGHHSLKKKIKRSIQWNQALKWTAWDDATAVKETRVCNAHFISGKLWFLSPACKAMRKSLDFRKNCLSAHIRTSEAYIAFLFCGDGYSFPFVLIILFGEGPWACTLFSACQFSGSVMLVCNKGVDMKGRKVI